MTGTINSSTPIWQLIPRTIHFSNGDELDYDFDFSKADFVISANGNYTLSARPEYVNNQTFRIVIVPASFSKTLNTNNYAEVMNALNINESQIQKVNF